uniref:Tf2-1-like SH3-like domain-containing protein n=1 Tax=Ananas comosus var. bracteatus TaxID=296719 RepID=A0A6V7NFB9_ANACO|nr:unnamed protein product [Ananas comosus var. bracteatus]
MDPVIVARWARRSSVTADGFHLTQDDLLRYHGSLCMPNDLERKKDIMTEAHQSPYSIHPDGMRMYRDLKQDFWWPGMKADVAQFVAKCLVCQEHVLLKVSPAKEIKRFGLRGKFSPRFIGPFEILERVGPVAYRLALPPILTRVHNVFHVSMLRKYISDPSYVISPSMIDLCEDLSFEEALVWIMESEERQLWNRAIPYVKVLCTNHGRMRLFGS